MKKVTDDIKDFFKNNAKIRKLSVICLILIFILIFINVIGSSSSFNKKFTSISNSGAKENSTDVSNQKVMTSDDYEEKQKVDLINILKKMDGVGDVDVMITFENGEEKVLAYDKTQQKSTTEENDTQGGKRVNNQNNDN